MKTRRLRLLGRAKIPIYKYFKGHGKEVMADMKAKHGDKAGEREFYATANARGMKPGQKSVLYKKKTS